MMRVIWTRSLYHHHHRPCHRNQLHHRHFAIVMPMSMIMTMTIKDILIINTEIRIITMHIIIPIVKPVVAIMASV